MILFVFYLNLVRARSFRIQIITGALIILVQHNHVYKRSNKRIAQIYLIIIMFNHLLIFFKNFPIFYNFSKNVPCHVSIETSIMKLLLLKTETLIESNLYNFLQARIIFAFFINFTEYCLTKIIALKWQYFGVITPWKFFMPWFNKLRIGRR